MDTNNQSLTNESLQQPAAPPSTPPSIPHKSKIPFFILIAFVFLVIIGGGGYLIQSSKFKVQNSNPQQNLTLIPTSTLFPTPTTDTTANLNQIGASWKTYTNTKYGYEVKYPKEIPFEETLYGVRIDKQIRISVSPKSNTVVHGDGPVYETSENIKVANLDAKQYTGYHGSMEGQPQRFIEVEINHNNYTYNLHLYALKQDNDLPLDDQIKEIPDSEIKFFNQILSTFRFTP